MTSKVRLIALLCGLTVNPLFGQTPQQRYFQWTSLPFSKEELKERRQNLIWNLDEESGYVVIPSADGYTRGATFRQSDDFYYFTGLELPNSILLIDLQKKTSQIYAPAWDFRFESSSRPNDFPGRPLADDPEIALQAGIEILDMEQFNTRLEAVSSSTTTLFINNGRPGSVSGISDDYISSPTAEQLLQRAIHSRFEDFKFKNAYDAIAELRMIKSEAEIALMKEAIQITIGAIHEAAHKVRPGVDERYLEGVLEGSYKMNGSSRLGFASIIKSGPNSLWPWRILAAHYNRRNRLLQEGELVIFDVGCEYQHYVTDMGRTFPVSGKFTSRQREVLEMEIAISDQIIEFIQPGITFGDIRKLTDRVIPEDAKPHMQASLYFGHHIGMSSGDPNLQDVPLEPGMVFTVEPWYYNHKEGISVFTEDVVLVTEQGAEVLTNKLPRSPAELEAFMRD